MKNKFIWLGLSFLLVTAMLLASCSTSPTTTTTATTNTSTTPSQTTAITTITNTEPLTTSLTSTTTTTGHWWDSLGAPQYGGSMSIRMAANIANFDPYNSDQIANIDSAWMEKLNEDDWTVNPAVFKYILPFRPSDYCGGQLAQTWEMTDLSTYVVHLHQGIHWQNIPPLNGREFVASDVVFHYDRIYGLGDGYTQPAPTFGGGVWADLQSVTAPDKYTVVFKWKTPNPEQIMETVQAGSDVQCIEAPDAVQLWGNLSDWHHAVGTGPWILSDFVSGSSATLVKDPNYWGYDERYPQNRLPYMNSLNILIIPDNATALAGFRTGKIEALDGISLKDAQLMQKTNPAVLQVIFPMATSHSVDPNVSVSPFNDIRVRQAMQMAIDLPTISNTYYDGTCSPNPSSLTSNNLTGWGLPYDKWPQALKDQYSYNLTAAKQLLAAAGYPTGFKTNIVADSASDLDLLQIVKSYFAAVGIDMQIQTLDSSSWTSIVAIQHKVGQLAYRTTGSVGNSTEPIRQLSRLQPGQGSNWEMINDPVINAWFPTALAMSNVSDIKKYVSDANLYFAQQQYIISLVTPSNFAVYQPWLKGYNGQANSISGVTGPLHMSFYLARFWIDQKLKASMGF